MGTSIDSTFDVERFGQRDFLRAADINRMTLVNPRSCDIENPLLACSAAPARLLRNHRERRQFVHEAKLALRLAALGNFAGIHVDSALEQASMEVGGECAAVSQRIARSFVFATRDMRQELTRTLMPLARIGLVDGVNAPVRRHLHVFLPENEFAEASIEGENFDTRPRTINQLRRRTI